MALLLKICGLNTLHALNASLTAGADWVGLTFHPKSPRFVDLPLAADLADEARGRAQIVALVCDADDKALDAINETVMPDIWQLHGRETPMRVTEIKARYKVPVMKAIGVAGPADLATLPLYAKIADHLLLDAKAPAGAAYPGGHGKPFDWSILTALDPALPFMLAGGLTPLSVGEAIRQVRALKCNLIGVDVSSGVERAPGQKSIEKIKAFIKEARKA